MTRNTQARGGRPSDGPSTADEPTVTMVATPGDGSCGIGTYARDLRSALGLPVETVPVPPDELSVLGTLLLAVRTARADGEVVHVQHEYGLFGRPESRYPGVLGTLFFPLLWLSTRLRGGAVVVTLHSVLDPDPDEASFAVRLYLLVHHKLLAVVADHLIFLSADCERRFRERVATGSGGHSRLPHGVNADVPVEVSREAAKRWLGYDPDESVVAVPGFVRPPKGHDVFVEVARRLPDREFLIAGGARPAGEDAAFAREVAADAPDNVTITGVLDDEGFWRALSAPDLAVLPYRVVTQSGTFNCCAARGLPVLASDEPYFERIRSKWGAPETVDPTDPDAIAERVRALLEDDERRRRLRENVEAYRRANSFERVGARHRRIYRRVAAGAPREDRARSDSNPGSAPATAACSARRAATD